MKPRIVLLGTGTAFHSDGRGSQAILLEDASVGSLLVDIGPTAMCAMTRYGVDYERIDRLFVTHLHGDHVAGWPFFVLNLALEKRRTRPFDVWGPVGVRDSLEGLVGLCYGEIVSEAKRSFEVRYHELALEERSGIDVGRGLTLDVLPMRHHPTSIAYRFLWGARSVAVTGDTGWCENLERLARGSRWLLTECTWREEGPGPHLSLAELRRGRERLGDCEILLVHLTDEVAAALAAQPIRGVSATHDGLELRSGGESDPRRCDKVAPGSHLACMAGIKTVGVKELKNNLSAYLRDVRRGLRILVSDRTLDNAEALGLV